MLRWCQSTLRTLDGYGRKYASVPQPQRPGVAALTEKPYFPRRHFYHNNPINIGDEGHDSEVSAGILKESQSSERKCVTSIQRTPEHIICDSPRPALKEFDEKDTTPPSRPSVSKRFSRRPKISPETPPPSTSPPNVNNNPLAIASFRACVARARRSRDGKSSLDSLHESYDIVKDKTDDPDVHLSYFHLLASSSISTHLPRVVSGLCGVLQRVPDPHPRFPAFLWDLMIIHGRQFNPELKKQVLETILYRLDTKPRLQQSPFLDSITAPGLTSELIQQEIIGIPHLSAAFANTVFRCYNPHYPYRFLTRWATQQACHALAPHLSLDVRWNNLMLLAVSLSPKDVEVQYNPSATSSIGSASILWRTALMLESLTRKMPKDKYGFGSQCGKVQDVVRPLWKSFLSADLANLPIDITRAYVSTFLRIAATSFDERMKGECHRLSQQLGLWDHSATDVRSTRAQAVNILAAYGTAYIACEGRDWKGLYATIAAVLPDLSWRINVTNVLIRWYLSENVETAYDLYIHSLETGFSISQPTLAALLRELVNQQRWDITSMFLEHPSTSRENLELLFGHSLSVFQTQRYRNVDARYVRLLAHTAFRLYAHQPSPPPPRTLKYPIRYLLSMMVWTHNFSAMVRLVEVLCSTVPNFFTPRFMRSLVFDLVRRRAVPNALKLLRIFSGVEGEKTSLSLEAIRRQLVFRFFKLGARKAALRLTRRKTKIESLSKREALTHVALSGLPSPESHRHIRRIVSQAKGDGSTIREAVSLLLKAKRPWSARKLYAKSLASLDPKTKTVIGNMIIHSPMLHKDFCHARLVRRVLKLKNVFIKEYEFTPDRTTLNIIIKAILRWKTMVDAPKVRRLFDNMVHEGYPVPLEFRQPAAGAGAGHGVPFGSPHGPFHSLAISELPKGISFSKHVRPMYKMFIKAFYVRGDIVAAKTVVGILKAVEVEEIREFEKRSRARREGVIRKRLKELSKQKKSGKVKVGGGGGKGAKGV